MPPALLSLTVIAAVCGLGATYTITKDVNSRARSAYPIRPADRHGRAVHAMVAHITADMSRAALAREPRNLVREIDTMTANRELAPAWVGHRKKTSRDGKRAHMVLVVRPQTRAHEAVPRWPSDYVGMQLVAGEWFFLMMLHEYMAENPMMRKLNPWPHWELTFARTWVAKHGDARYVEPVGFTKLAREPASPSDVTGLAYFAVNEVRRKHREPCTDGKPSKGKKCSGLGAIVSVETQGLSEDFGEGVENVHWKRGAAVRMWYISFLTVDEHDRSAPADQHAAAVAVQGDGSMQQGKIDPKKLSLKALHSKLSGASVIEVQTLLRRTTLAQFGEAEQRIFREALVYTFMGKVKTRDFSHPADPDLYSREGGPIEIEIADIAAHSSSSVKFVWSMSVAGAMEELVMMLASPSVVEAVSVAITNLARHYHVQHLKVGRDDVVFSAPYTCSARCGAARHGTTGHQSLSYFAQQPHKKPLRSLKMQKPAEDDDDEGSAQTVSNPWSQAIITPRAYASKHAPK